MDLSEGKHSAVCVLFSINFFFSPSKMQNALAGASGIMLTYL